MCKYRKLAERILCEYTSNYKRLTESELYEIFNLNNFVENKENHNLGKYQAESIRLFNELYNKVAKGKMTQYDNGLEIKLDDLVVKVIFDENDSKTAATYNVEAGNEIQVYTDNVFNLFVEPYSNALIHELIHYLSLKDYNKDIRLNKINDITDITNPYKNKEEKLAYLNELVFYLSNQVINIYSSLTKAQQQKFLDTNGIITNIHKMIAEIVNRDDHAYSAFLRSFSKEELNDILDEITEYILNYISSQLKENSFSFIVYDCFMKVLNG